MQDVTGYIHSMPDKSSQNEKEKLLTKVFTLNLNFSKNVVGLISQDLKLNFLKKKTINKAEEDLEGQHLRAKQKWEKITHFLLNIDNI